MNRDDPRTALEELLRCLHEIRKDPSATYRNPVTEKLLEYFDPQTGRVDWEAYERAQDEESWR